jgi:hypothetical protein
MNPLNLFSHQGSFVGRTQRPKLKPPVYLDYFNVNLICLILSHFASVLQQNLIHRTSHYIIA